MAKQSFSITDADSVALYESTHGVFEGLISEIRELSKKKPDATMSAAKVKLVNRVLGDLLLFLKQEPTGKYLDLLDEDTLPQMSDAVLVMVQYEKALGSFYGKYFRYFEGDHVWITQEFVASLPKQRRPG